MRLREVSLLWYRSVDHLEFDVKPFTVLYGRNNSGKTNILEAIYGVLAPAEARVGSIRHRGALGVDMMV
jgi:recombinational DNA repair ATPase RecF